MRWLCLVSSTSAFSPSIFVSRLPAHLLNCFFNSGLFTSWSNIHWLMWPGFIVTRALRSGTHLSVIMSMHPNTRLDLSATYYTNMWYFPQQTHIVGILCNTSPNKRWFVQFPPGTEVEGRIDRSEHHQFSSDACLRLPVWSCSIRRISVHFPALACTVL